MRFIHVDNRKQFIAIMGVQCGAIHEPKHLSGISHFLEHAMFKSKDVVVNMMNNGIIYNARTGLDFTLFFVTCDSKDCVKAFNILKDIVTVFSLNQKDFEKEKRVVLEELALSGNEKNIFKLLHKGTPYESRTIGLRSTLEKLQLKDVQNFYDQHYQEIFTIVFCHSQWESKLKKMAIQKLEPSVIHYMNINTNRILNSKDNTLVMKTSNNYTSGQIGFLGYPASDPKNMTLKFIAYILNGYLFDVLREKMGIVYHASCVYYGMMHTGFFSIRFYTYSGTAEEVFKFVKRLIKRIKTISKIEIQHIFRK